MTNCKYYKNIIKLSFFLFVSISFSQNDNSEFRQIEQSFYTIYSAKEYKSNPSNWSLIQDNRGIIYIGNSEGVLEYDGSSWRKIELPHSQLVRAFTIDDNGRVYLTADTDFGYLEPDSIGQMKFTSLTDIIGDQYNSTNEIWDIAVNSEGIFFKSDNKLYRWSNNKLKTWDSVNSFRLYEIDDEIYSRNNGLGLVKVVGDSLVSIPGGDYFSSIGVFDMLPVKNKNPNKKNKILITTNYTGVYLYDGEIVTHLKTDVDEYLIQNQIYNSCVLENGNYAFATQRGGVVVVDHTGKLIKIIDENSGLPTNVAYDVLADRQNGLWVATDNGVARFEIPSPLKIIPKKYFRNNMLTSIIRYENNLYGANSIGVLLFNEATLSFELVEGSDKPGYSFSIEHDNLIAATNAGAVIVKGNSISKILTEDSSYKIEYSKYFPGRIYVGHRTGLKILDKDYLGNYKVYQTSIELGELYAIVEESEKSLWVRSDHGRILHIKGNLEYLTSEKDSLLSFQVYDESTGFQVSEWGIFDLNNRMVLTTDKGTFNFSNETQRFVSDTTLGFPLFNSTHLIKQLEKSTNGDLWILAKSDDGHELGKAVLQKNRTYKWKPNPVFNRLDLSNVFTFYSDVDSTSRRETLWISTDEDLVKYSPTVNKNVEIDYSTLIRKVSVKNDSIIFGGTKLTIPATSKVILPYAYNDLTFESSALGFDKQNVTLYQYYLEGNDDTWSQLTNEYKKEYTNLSSGDYNYHVRSKNIYGVIGKEDSFVFKILAPWYFTWWAYTLYGLMFAIGIFVVDRFQRGRLIKVERNRATLREAKLIKKQAEELETVDRLVRIINRADDLERLFNSLLIQTISFIPQAEKAAIFLLDHNDNMFHVAYTLGYEVADHGDITFSHEDLRKRYTENSNEIEKGIYIVSHTNNLSSEKKMSRFKKSKSMLVMAVEWEKRLEAYVVFDSFADKNVFDPSTARILNRFRVHAVSAISKAQSIKTLQEKNEEIIKAQEQLLVQEKLASLGALTAGIAHEIKNPLNFVNNFAEVSLEMIDELNETVESEKSKISEEKYLTMKELTGILEENIKKINNHGKRADSIIKGMLQHSRGGSGKKTEVNINDLLDQYVDLAYHGLRAQDKEFNITIVRKYDKSIGKLKVVPQDISRVFLNVINNACYAANQKKKKSGTEFEPILKVSTKETKENIEIRIGDNGNGIPESIRDNIFTPFFTTKPTGEGTGLGLSLSHDIITKGHSGIMKVETEEGKGTTFIILLAKQN